MCVSWRKALRRLWSLPAQTHCDLLYRICNCWPLEDELYRRCILFSLRCLRSENRVVNFIAKCAIDYEKMRSPIGRNFINGCIRFNVSTNWVRSSANECCFTGNRFRKFCSADPSPWKTSFLLECLFLRDNSFSLSFGNGEDNVNSINDIISYLCMSWRHIVVIWTPIVFLVSFYIFNCFG